MSENVAKFVGSIPEYYERGLGPVLFAPYARLTAERVAAAPVARALEVAAGTGILTRALRDRLPDGAEIVATDLSAPMLEVAKAKLAGARGVTFATADAQALPYTDGAFDLLCCQFGVMFFPDKPRAYAEARRVLKSGGRYVFSVWDAPQANPFTGLVGEAVREAFPDNPPHFLETPFGYSAIDPIRAALHDAGFGRMTIEVLPVSAPTPDLRSFAEAQILGSPLSAEARDRGGDPARLVEALAEKLQARFGAASEMPLRALLFDAVAT